MSSLFGSSNPETTYDPSKVAKPPGPSGLEGFFSSFSEQIDNQARNIPSAASVMEQGLKSLEGRTPLSESFMTAFSSAWDRTSHGVNQDIHDAYEGYIDGIVKHLGQHTPASPDDIRELLRTEGIENPYSAFAPTFVPGRFAEPEYEGGPVDPSQKKLKDDYRAKVDGFHNKLAELAKKYPMIALRSESDVLNDAAAIRQQTAKKREEAAAGEVGLISFLASLGGEIAGAVSDPVTAFTLPLGGGMGTGFKGAVKFLLTEAAIGGGSGAMSDVAFQEARKAIGEKPNYGETGEAAVMNALGGGIFAGLGLAGRKVYYALKETLKDPRNRVAVADQYPELVEDNPQLAEAIDKEREKIDLADTNPFGPEEGGSTLHTKRLDLAEEALQEGRLFPEQEVTAGDSTSHLSERDKQALDDFIEMADNDPDTFNEWIPVLKNMADEGIEGEETLAEFVNSARKAANETVPAVRVNDREALAEAAIVVDDKIYSGRTHSEAVEKAHKAGASDDAIMAGAERSGYVTTTGRFIPEEEAITVAHNAGQMVTDHLASDALVNFPLQVGDNSPRILRGKPGDIHVYVTERYGIPDDDFDKLEELQGLGFVDKAGRYYTRDEARARLKLAKDYQGTDGIEGEIGAFDLRHRQGNAIDADLPYLLDAAKKAGYPVETVDDLARLLNKELNDGQPTYKADANSTGALSAQDQMSLLTRLGIPYKGLTPSEVLARMRAKHEALTVAKNPKRKLRDVEDVEKQKQAIAVAENARLDKALENEADIDAYVDQEFDKLINTQTEAKKTFGDEFEELTVALPMEDGGTRVLSLSELQRRMEWEEREVKAVRNCLLGGKN